MARGDVPVSLTLPSEIDKLINKMAQKQGQKAGKVVSRREIVIQAVKLLAEETAKGAKA